MRIEKGAKVYVLSKYSGEIQVIKEIVESEAWRKSYVLLKPLVAQVRVRNTTLRLGIPTASILTEESLTSREPDLILDEDVWADAKRFIESEEIAFSGSYLTEKFPFLGKLSGRGSLVGVSLCSVLDSVGSIGLSDYLTKLINTKHVLFTHSLKEGEKKLVKGVLRSFWTTHFILSGLDIPSEESSLESHLEVSEVPKLKILLKPLLSINEHVILGELPLNRSLIINYSRTTNENLEYLLSEVLIKSLVYTC
jgi:hypothetical protein